MAEDVVAKLQSGLQKLYGYRGVERDLRQTLSAELALAWGIDPGKWTASQTRSAVIRELHTLIESAGDPWSQTLLEVAYNLRDDIPAEDRESFQARFNWCRFNDNSIIPGNAPSSKSADRQVKALSSDLAKVLAPRYLAALEAEEARRAALATVIDEAAPESTTVADSNTTQQLHADPSPASRKRIFEKRWPQVAVVAALLASGIAALKFLPDSTAGNFSPSSSSTPPVMLGSYVDLSATVTSATAYDGSYDVLFDAGKLTIAEQYRSLQSALPPEAAKAFVNALRDGAFARGGALVTVEVRSLADKDIRVVGVELHTLHCPNDRAREVVRFNARTDLPRVDFGLTVTPVPSPVREVSSKSGELSFGDEYFKQRQRGVRYGAPEQLTMAFKAGASRCSFNVALRYTANGDELPAVLLRKIDSDAPFTVSVAPVA